MVDFYGVGQPGEVVQTPVKNLEQASSKTGTKVVPMTGGADNKHNSTKGTSVQHSGGNPFYAETEFEHFDGLGGSGMTQADSATKRVKGELARLYNEVRKSNPEAVENLEFPPLPSVPAKGKKALKLEAYLSALDQYRQTCEELLEGVKEKTVVDEVRDGNAAVIGEVRGAAQAVTNTVVEMGSANLAATLGVGAAMLNGLQTIYNKIDTDTHTIIAAVDSNGKKILRAINKQTREIKQFIAEDGDRTRLQQFLNTVALDRNMSARIEGVHRHINDNGNWVVDRVGDRITDAEAGIREHINKAERRITEHVTEEHKETRNFTQEEIEEHSVFWHGIPDPFGLWDRIF